MTNIKEVKEVKAFKTSDGKLHKTEEQAIKAEKKIVQNKAEKTNKKIVEGIRHVNFTWSDDESIMDIFASHPDHSGKLFDEDGDSFRVIAYRPDNKEEVDALYNYYQNINNICSVSDGEDNIHNSLLKIKNLTPGTFIFVKYFNDGKWDDDEPYAEAMDITDITTKIANDLKEMERRYKERRDDYMESGKSFWSEFNKHCKTVAEEQNNKEQV